MNRKRIRLAALFGHVMRREKLEHLVTTGMIEGKRSMGKQREKMLIGLDLAKERNVGRATDALKATMDRAREAWKVVIAYAKEHLID